MDCGNLDSKFAFVKQFVEFVDVALQYPCDKNLSCRYRFVDYESQEGDRIAVYKLGWTSVKDYVVFEWAPINDLTENTIVFDKYSLPKSATEMYQMCYVSSENQMYGISAPFQFCDVSLHCLDLASSMTESSMKDGNGDLEKDVLSLKMENKMLQHSLRDVMDHLLSMQKILCSQQKEINLLRETCFGNKVLRSSDCDFGFVDGVSSSLENEFDVGELEAMPPFPFTK